MVTLESDKLVFSAPDVHPHASVTITFQRTLRIPDDDREYPLPPGLGLFPIRHVDDFAQKVPQAWGDRGGVMIPIYQSEAMWLSFDCAYIDHQGEYPFAIKIAAGKINAVTGNAWSNGLCATPQDYVVVPEQCWLDGFCAGEGVIRQFVAMPLGSGYSAEEQITGRGEHGGLQIVAYPMKRKIFEKRFRKKKWNMGGQLLHCCFGKMSEEMGLAPGGKMKQSIYNDPFNFDDWDTTHPSRCFIHMCNSMAWRQITGAFPPDPPMTAKEYNANGLPWFDYYSESPCIKASAKLAALQSVAKIAAIKGDVLPAGAETLDVHHTIQLRKKGHSNEVRVGNF